MSLFKKDICTPEFMETNDYVQAKSHELNTELAKMTAKSDELSALAESAVAYANMHGLTSKRGLWGGRGRKRKTRKQKAKQRRKY